MTTNRNMLERAKQSSTELLREKMQMFLDNIDLNEETTDEATGLIFVIELAQRLDKALISIKEKQSVVVAESITPIDNEKIIDELKTIVFTTTNATGEGDLDDALQLYFEKKSVVENITDTQHN